MNVATVMDQMTCVFRQVFDNDSVILESETTANDVEDWDSLTQIELVVALEKCFKIKFTLSEVQKLKNVGEMCDCIMKKLG